jgi:hypothetical protein
VSSNTLNRKLGIFRCDFDRGDLVEIKPARFGGLGNLSPTRIYYSLPHTPFSQGGVGLKIQLSDSGSPREEGHELELISGEESGKSRGFRPKGAALVPERWLVKHMVLPAFTKRTMPSRDVFQYPFLGVWSRPRYSTGKSPGGRLLVRLSGMKKRVPSGRSDVSFRPDIFSASSRSFASAKTAKDAKAYPPCCGGSRGS